MNIAIFSVYAYFRRANPLAAPQPAGGCPGDRGPGAVRVEGEAGIRFLGAGHGGPRGDECRAGGLPGRVGERLPDRADAEADAPVPGPVQCEHDVERGRGVGEQRLDLVA